MSAALLFGIAAGGTALLFAAGAHATSPIPSGTGIFDGDGVPMSASAVASAIASTQDSIDQIMVELSRADEQAPAQQAALKAELSRLQELLAKYQGA